MRLQRAALLAISVGVCLATPCLALETGRSIAMDTSLLFKDCRPHDEVCGLMSAGTYRLFDNRCEARAAGAHRIRRVRRRRLMEVRAPSRRTGTMEEIVSGPPSAARPLRLKEDP